MATSAVLNGLTAASNYSEGDTAQGGSYILVELSSSSLHHLQAVLEASCTWRFTNTRTSIRVAKRGAPNVLTPNERFCNRFQSGALQNMQSIEQTGAILQISVEGKTLTKFALFTKLPVELQHWIWKEWAGSKPGRVRLTSTHYYQNNDRTNEFSNIFYDMISKKDALKILGYTSFSITAPSGADANTSISTTNFILNPSNDLLYITRKSAIYWVALMSQAKGSGAVDVVRSIAIHRGCSNFQAIITNLQAFRSLEVVYVVVSWIVAYSYAEWTAEDSYCFQHVYTDREYADGVVYTSVKRNIIGYQEGLQKIVAEGREGKVPQVILVRELEKPESKKKKGKSEMLVRSHIKEHK